MSSSKSDTLAENRQGLVGRYIGSRSKWIAAGKPVRTEEEVEHILENHCKPCKWYKKITRRMGRCKLCGCSLNLGRKLNKLYWATESCPDNPPRWTATVRDIPMATTRVERQKKRERRARRKARDEAKVLEAKKQEAHEQKVEQKQTRKERIAARQERIRKRNEKKALTLGELPDKIELPLNTDPLKVTDRHKNNTHHAMRDFWKMRPAFIVCGGPSINQLDLSLLEDPAVCSMGVNNVAAHAPVKSFVCSDPPEKFHHAIWLNPGILKFVPTKKLGKRVRGKKDGVFKFTTLNVADCPSVFGFARNSTWEPDLFLTREIASWGAGKAFAQAKGIQRVLFTPLLALRLLHYLGCNRVYLLGWDFNMDSGMTGGYAFDQARTQGAAAGNNTQYRGVNGMLKQIRPVMEAANFYVYNCNPESRCDAFEYVPYEKAVEDCLSLMPPKPYDLSQWYEKDIRKPPMEDGEEPDREDEE